MIKIVVFLGPSLPLSHAQHILDATYLPPASQSDLLSVVQIYQPDVIALIDGVFLSCPSTWHKEILFALSQGIAVYGASSMGALRAAELDSFGMVGVGRIYELYASGELIDDDEVALIYGGAETGYQPMSEPIINVRATLNQAQAQGVISHEHCQQLMVVAKEIYFPQRTFAALFREAKTAGIAIESLDCLQDFVREHRVDQKRQDAILLLETLRDRFILSSLNDFPSSKIDKDTTAMHGFKLAQTHTFAALYERDRQVKRQDVWVPLRQISECFALQSPAFDDLNFHSLNRILVQILATHLNLSTDHAEIELEKKRFCAKHNLSSEIEFEQWIAENDLSATEFQELMQQIATCRRLHRWLLNRQVYQRNIKGLLDELRLENLYTTWATIAAEQEEQFCDEQLNPNFTPEYSQGFKELLSEQFKAMSVRIPPIPFEDWKFERGFLSTECLHAALQRAKAWRESKSIE